MFFKMYFKESFSQLFLNDYNLDAFLEVPLTVDDDFVDIPEEL
jgi:hypothetical protein